jgi:hypothetical protein
MMTAYPDDMLRRLDTDRILARISAVLATGDLKQPITRVLRLALAAQPNMDATAISATINALLDLSCAVDFARAYASPACTDGQPQLAYALKYFVEALQTYLTRTAAWAPVVDLLVVGAPRSQPPHLDHALFRAVAELLLAALDAGSPACGVALCTGYDTQFLRIWSNGDPWSAGHGKQIYDDELNRLRAIGVHLTNGQAQVIDRQKRTEVLLILMDAADPEVAHGAV